jgi:hypothetical protein
VKNDLCRQTPVTFGVYDADLSETNGQQSGQEMSALPAPAVGKNTGTNHPTAPAQAGVYALIPSIRRVFGSSAWIPASAGMTLIGYSRLAILS